MSLDRCCIGSLPWSKRRGVKPCFVSSFFFWLFFLSLCIYPIPFLSHYVLVNPGLVQVIGEGAQIWSYYYFPPFFRATYCFNIPILPECIFFFFPLWDFYFYSC
ncbi:hypothetical protein B0J18DRAFT_116600 [Chaetomium sp. MPI-SDFR-AT-0129]|nr:hypothetical protein B0J18DRAFT_116600 [Chaetomium sp. MPI-SDFR-AT-0129]